MNETTVSEAISQSNEAQSIIERDCMRCEQTFTTTREANEDYCEKCRAPSLPPAVVTPRKWTTQAGPIQSKRVREAISKISWEGRTCVELSGVIGGEEHRFAYTNVYGGQSEASIAALEAVAVKFDYTVTRENCQAIIAECERLVAELARNRPVNDKRETPEQRAETIRKNQEAAAKREAEAAERRAAQEVIDAERKAQAEALRASEPVTSEAGTVVRYNREHDGVEISFPEKPDKSVIASCKSHGFRWSMRNKCWYHKFDSSSWLAAHRIAGIPTAERPARRESNPDGAYVQAQEEAFQSAECERIGA